MGNEQTTVSFYAKLEDDCNLNADDIQVVDDLLDSLKDSNENVARQTLMKYIFPQYGSSVYVESFNEWRRRKWLKEQQDREMQTMIQLAKQRERTKRDNETRKSGNSFKETLKNFFNPESDWTLEDRVALIRRPLIYIVLAIVAMHVAGHGGLSGVILLYLVRTYYKQKESEYGTEDYVESVKNTMLSWFVQIAIIFYIILCAGSINHQF